MTDQKWISQKEKAIFKLAAKIVLQKHYNSCGGYEGACIAIEWAGRELNLNSALCAKLFAELYEPQNSTDQRMYWFGELDNVTSKARSLALLFCAELCDE